MLSIPGGWFSLYTCPPGMGGHNAMVSETSSFLFVLITVMFEELSLSSEFSCMFRFHKIFDDCVVFVRV